MKEETNDHPVVDMKVKTTYNMMVILKNRIIKERKWIDDSKQ